MSEADKMATEYWKRQCDMRDAILKQWIRDANEGRIKDGKRELSNDELAMIGNVLCCIAGDIEVRRCAETEGASEIIKSCNPDEPELPRQTPNGQWLESSERGEKKMTMNQPIPARLLNNRCNEWLGPFRCELPDGHSGPHQWDSKEVEILHKCEHGAIVIIKKSSMTPKVES